MTYSFRRRGSDPRNRATTFGLVTSEWRELTRIETDIGSAVGLSGIDPENSLFVPATLNTANVAMAFFRPFSEPSCPIQTMDGMMEFLRMREYGWTLSVCVSRNLSAAIAPWA